MQKILIAGNATVGLIFCSFLVLLCLGFDGSILFGEYILCSVNVLFTSLFVVLGIRVNLVVQRTMSSARATKGGSFSNSKNNEKAKSREGVLRRLRIMAICLCVFFCIQSFLSIYAAISASFFDYSVRSVDLFTHFILLIVLFYGYNSQLSRIRMEAAVQMAEMFRNSARDVSKSSKGWDKVKRRLTRIRAPSASASPHLAARSSRERLAKIMKKRTHSPCDLSHGTTLSKINENKTPMSVSGKMTPEFKSTSSINIVFQEIGGVLLSQSRIKPISPRVGSESALPSSLPAVNDELQLAQVIVENGVLSEINKEESISRTKATQL